MGRFSLAGAVFDDGILSEESVRDQLSAAEELVYVGHREPALVAAGAALEGALRVRAGAMVGPDASVGALLEALLSMGAVEESEYDLLLHALAARDRLIHGYSPQRCDTTDPDRIWSVLQITVRLLERPIRRAGGRSIRT